MAKEKLVKRKESVTVYGTGKSYLGVNEEFVLHPVAAEKLIAKGAASAEKITGKAATKGTGAPGLGTGITQSGDKPGAGDKK